MKLLPKTPNSSPRRRRLSLVILSLLVISLLCLAAQMRPTVVDNSFTKARKAGRAKTGRKKNTYKVETADRPLPEPATTQAEIGVTLWQLRPSLPSDTGARMLIQEDDDSAPQELTPVRVESGISLKEGQQVRLAIESSRPGYLYVVDQEQYSDSSTGDPYLIFPTTRTRSGDNRVEPGLLVEIPDRSDRPNYFTIRRQRPDEVSENLMLLLADKPIADIKPGRQPLKLTRELVSTWQRQWGVQAEHLELEGGAGMQWTEQEKSASGSSGTRMLTQDDPLPQTVFRVNPRLGNPILINVPLKLN